MVVIRSTSQVGDQTNEDDLVNELANELQRAVGPSRPMCQPIIIENLLPQTNTLHVAVIWERWQLVPAGRRSRLIVDAYQQAAPDRVDQVTIALGATTEEAIDLGLLPYGIEPTTGRSDDQREQELRKLMRDEGAVTTPSGLLLRFPNIEAANPAHARLVKQTDADHWALVRYETPNTGT